MVLNHTKGRFNSMKISLNKSDLLKGVNIASKAVPSKTTMSILQCILIDASSEEIRLVANDTEIAIQTYVEGEIIEPGKIALDAKTFLSIVSKLPDNIVVIETSDNYNTLIKCENINFNLPGKDGEIFTDLPKFQKEECLVISNYSLKEMIRRTIFSISENDSNKTLRGELFDIKNGNFRIMSLDGQRVSIRKIEINDTEINRNVIVPGKSLNELIKILGGETDKNVNIYFSENYIVFDFDDTIMLSRLIEGEFFNIDHILSTDYETKVSINKKMLLDCIDRSTLLVKEGDKKPLVVNIIDDSMEIKIKSAIGSMNDKIDISKEGTDIKIGFNPKYLIDALRVIDDDNITINFLNAKSPCFIRNNDDSYIYMILPVNVNNVE